MWSCKGSGKCGLCLGSQVASEKWGFHCSRRGKWTWDPLVASTPVFEALLGIHGLRDLLPGHTGPGGHMPGLPPQGRKTIVHTLCHLSGHQWLSELPMLFRLCE